MDLTIRARSTNVAFLKKKSTKVAIRDDESSKRLHCTIGCQKLDGGHITIEPGRYAQGPLILPRLQSLQVLAHPRLSAPGPRIAEKPHRSTLYIYVRTPVVAVAQGGDFDPD
jgi:hypothetical protein